MLEMKSDFTPGIKGIADVLDENVARFIEDVLDLTLQYAIDNLKKNQSWVTGNLAQSGRVEIETEEEIEGILIFGAPYASAVEFGTKPYVAPLGPGLAYTQKKARKGKKPRPIIGSTPDMLDNPLDYWAWKKGKKGGMHCWLDGKYYGVHTWLGWAVWKKIMARGQSPHPYLRPAMDRIMNEIPLIAQRHGLEFE
jgi:hypothetical protein